MKKNPAILSLIILLFFLAGCVTLRDVQRYTDLIRTENEIARILTEESSIESPDKEAKLSILGDHAKKQADTLKKDPATYPDAIAYYRIATTAYWQSWKPDTVEKFFNSAESGQKLCAQLDETAPDRDCIYLKLVVPFAGLEAEDKKVNPQTLSQVNFADKNATATEIEHMEAIYSSLKLSKRLLTHMIAIEKDARLMSHTGMKAYYCRNSKRVIDRYKALWKGFLVRVMEFHKKVQESARPLHITEEEARSLALPTNASGICR